MGASNRTPWQNFSKEIKKNKTAIASFFLIIFLFIIGLLANYVAPYSFDKQHIDFILSPPSSTFFLGTDSLGRDLFSRLIYGARISLTIAIVTAIISLIGGVVYGAISGWFGGWVDSIMMRFVDVLYSIPTLVLLILVKVIFDSLNTFENPELRALSGILLSLSILGWMSLARVVRGQVLQAKSLAFVESAQALGFSSFRIVLKHIIPNILGPIMVLITFQVPSNILFESFLSFIGLGLQPPFSSWGVLASEGWRSMRTYPHLILFPGIMLFFTMLAFNFLGDGLRDALDPKLKR
ncbi:MAG: ABC transporter permease [Bdellovibrionaceae bacterium]|nr:ABC transporter permease [Pseudobdellovibrionaceae bacterium]